MAREDASQYKLPELVSPPRVTVAAERAGFAAATPSNFDIKTGWDFFDAQRRAQFWRVMEEQEPDCVLMTPECRPFSTMMESNWDRMSTKDRERLQAEGLAMLHFCVQRGRAPVGQKQGVLLGATRLCEQSRNPRHGLVAATSWSHKVHLRPVHDRTVC